jgi:hypothetical protein
MSAAINKLQKMQEFLLRRLKKNAAIIFGWPMDKLPFKDIHSASAKFHVVRRFFSEFLSIPEGDQAELDIEGVFVKKHGTPHVIINFVRETGKEIVNPYLKNLQKFNENRNTPIIWRDDLTQQQLAIKKQKRQRRDHGNGENEDADGT